MRTFRLLCALCFALSASLTARSNAADSDASTADHDQSTARLTQGDVGIFSCSSGSLTASTSADEDIKNAKIPFKNVCFDEKILPSSQVTYFQALKQLFPDLKDDDKGQATHVRDRRSEIKGANLWLDDSDEYDLSRSIRYLLIEEKDQTQLIVLFEDMGFLALYGIKPRFKLLDFIDVRQDQHTSLFILQPYDVLPVRPGVWLFPISNWHDNSSQSYDSNLLFLTLDGKLRLAYDGPNFFGTRDAEHDECSEMSGLAELQVLDTRHDEFSDVSLKLSRKHICEVEDEKTGQTIKETTREKIYSAILHWDPQKRKYMGGSKEFVKDQRKD